MPTICYVQFANNWHNYTETCK